MKAHISEDLILAVNTGDTEIGPLPPGVGLERLRWDGTQIIDLAQVTEIHVRHLTGSHFELHTVPLANTQPVAMTWADRRDLIIVAGVIRLKTVAEITAGHLAEYNGQLKARLRQDLTASIGDPGDQVADINKMLYLLTEAINGDAEALAAIQNLLPEMRGTYSIGKSAVKLMANAKTLKESVPRYYKGKLI